MAPCLQVTSGLVCPLLLLHTEVAEQSQEAWCKSRKEGVPGGLGVSCLPIPSSLKDPTGFWGWEVCTAGLDILDVMQGQSGISWQSSTQPSGYLFWQVAPGLTTSDMAFRDSQRQLEVLSFLLGPVSIRIRLPLSFRGHSGCHRQQAGCLSPVQ